MLVFMPQQRLKATRIFELSKPLFESMNLFLPIIFSQEARINERPKFIVNVKYTEKMKNENLMQSTVTKEQPAGSPRSPRMS